MAAAAEARLTDLLQPVLREAGFDLERLTVGRAGARSVVRVVVDRDAGLDLDAVAAATRLVGSALDDADALAGAYVLEVTSPGVDRPLTQPRHWRRNVGRLVRVTLRQGGTVTGRVQAADDTGCELEAGGVQRRVHYGEVAKAVVQVEFGRTDDGEVSP